MSEVAVGSVIDSRYRITGELGQGGMGTVYQAEHVTIRRPVALKLLDPVLSRTAGASQRFEREAFAAGRIDHPNCVTVSDFGTHDDGTLYLVMELVRGTSLGELLDREGRLPIRRALHIIRHVLRGLAHAHAAGIVHRDIKPDNILLVDHAGDPDFAKILDFGIAKLLGEAEADEGGDKLTQAGFTVGTPAYLSPEQAFGEEIDSRTDLYSASVVLYELIAGAPPFRSDDKLAVLSMHVGKAVPPLRDTEPTLAPAPAVEALLMRGLAKKREDRIATAEQYVAELDRLLAAPGPAAGSPAPPVHVSARVPAQTPPPSGTEATVWAQSHTPAPGTTRAARRKRAWIITSVALAVVFAIAALAGSLLGNHDELLEDYVHQLKRGKTCEQRKQAVELLRGLGDKRAIKALKRARYRMRGGLAGIGAKNTNRCLRKDAQAAIDYLEGL